MPVEIGIIDMAPKPPITERLNHARIALGFTQRIVDKKHLAMTRLEAKYKAKPTPANDDRAGWAMKEYLSALGTWADVLGEVWKLEKALPKAVRSHGH